MMIGNMEGFNLFLLPLYILLMTETAFADKSSVSVDLVDGLAATILSASKHEAHSMRLSGDVAERALEIIDAKRTVMPDENKKCRFRAMLDGGFARVYCDSRESNRWEYVFLRAFSCDRAGGAFQYDLLDLKGCHPGDTHGHTDEGLTVGVGTLWREKSGRVRLEAKEEESRNP